MIIQDKHNPYLLTRSSVWLWAEDEFLSLLKYSLLMYPLI